MTKKSLLLSAVAGLAFTGVALAQAVSVSSGVLNITMEWQEY